MRRVGVESIFLFLLSFNSVRLLWFSSVSLALTFCQRRRSMVSYLKDRRTPIAMIKDDIMMAAENQGK